MTSKLTLESDFSQLAQVVGTIEGAAKVISDDKFMDKVLTNAHSEAAVQFDADAVVYALATGGLSHMFEWGTVGINNGRTTRRQDPLAASSKLWRHRIEGTGSFKQASFVFKPSVTPIPKPTVAKTGVPAAELRKLTGGPYIFAAKAAVMESGMTVTIRPLGDNKLFVPFGREGARGGRRRPQNFMFTRGPIYAVPGKKVAGNFTQFWTTWWASEGEKVIGDSVDRQVSTKLEALVDSAGRRMGRRPQKVAARTFKLDVDKARQQAERQMLEGLET